MNPIRIGFFIITLLSLMACKPVDDPEKEQQAIIEVTQLLQDVFDDIWSDKNISRIAVHHTADFLLLEHGEIWDNQTIADWCVRAQQRDQGVTRINSFELIDAKLNEDKLWMAYHNNAVLKTDSLTRNLQWLESVVAVKDNGKWKLELMHSTRKPQ